MLRSIHNRSATHLLNNMPQNTVNEASFIELQLINVARSQYGNNSITQSQINTVHSIATGITPSAGYAWTVYYILSGIYLDTPRRNTGSNPRSANNTESHMLSLSPNPAYNTLTLEGLDIDILEKITITTINGHATHVPNLTKNSNIDIEHLNKGLYVISLRLLSGETLTKKFIKI